MLIYGSQWDSASLERKKFERSGDPDLAKIVTPYYGPQIDSYSKVRCFLHGKDQIDILRVITSQYNQLCRNSQILWAKTQRQQVVQVYFDELTPGVVKHEDRDRRTEFSDKLSTDSTWRNGFFRVARNSNGDELLTALGLKFC